MGRCSASSSLTMPATPRTWVATSERQARSPSRRRCFASPPSERPVGTCVSQLLKVATALSDPRLGKLRRELTNQAPEHGVAQAAAVGPLNKFELASPLGFDPSAFFHLLCC